MRVIFVLLAMMLYLLSVQLYAQSEEQNSELEDLLDQVLVLASEEKWNEALALLDRAEDLDPGDPRIESFRQSILKLAALDDLEEASEVQEEGDEESLVESIEPKFVIERGGEDEKIDPSQFRHVFRGELELTIFEIDPLLDDPVNTWSSIDEFLYSSLAANLRYWFPVLKRSLGLDFSSNGYSWPPGKPAFLVNFLDFGLNLRGFLLEESNSRMEIGLDFGASYKTEKNVARNSLESALNLYLGFWVADPLLYHIFGSKALENLIVNGAVRFRSNRDNISTETINLSFDISWRFSSISAGARIEWWTFTYEPFRLFMPSFSLFAGFFY